MMIDRNRLFTALTALLLVTTALGAGVGTVAADDHEQDADLEIDQPHYVDGEVEIDTTGNYTTYSVEGSTQIIALEGTPEDAQVIDYGVEESRAGLTEHSTFDYYEFTANADGTYHVYFVVEYEETREETVQEGNNTTTRTTTETVRERHVAQISVTGSDTVPVSGATIEELRSDADNWTAWESEIREISGADANIEMKTQVAATLLDLRENPTKALTGEFFGVLIVLFISISGLAVLALFGGYHLFVTRSLRKRTNERETLEVEEADLEERIVELDDKERNSVLVNTTMFDWLDDEWSSRAMHEDLGEDSLSAYMNLSQVLGGGNILHDRLLAMGQDGYQAAVRLADDDSEAEDSPSYTSARVIHPDVDPDLDDDEVLVTLKDDETAAAVAAAVEPTDSEIFEYDLAEFDGRLCDMGPELKSPDSVEELIQELDADMRRFQGSEEAYAKYLTEFVENVRDHQFTDSHGRPKSIRYVLSSWLKTAQVGRDIFQMPLSEMHAEYLQKLLQDYDPAEDADMEIEQHRKGVTGNAAD